MAILGHGLNGKINIGNKMQPNIETFLQSAAFGVIGASSDRKKFGNKVLRCYIQNGLTVYPVNPTEVEIEKLPCFKNIAQLPDDVQSISIITPPAVTEKIVDQAIGKDIKNIWMQPGAQSEDAIQKCIKHGINVIANGPCILVTLHFIE